jgi:hypothetical protein
MQHVRKGPLMAYNTVGSDLIEIEFNRLHFVVGLEIELE